MLRLVQRRGRRPEGGYAQPERGRRGLSPRRRGRVPDGSGGGWLATSRHALCAARSLVPGPPSRAQPTPVASRVVARPTAASTLPLIASARTSPAACSHARIRHRWSIPPKGFVGLAIRTVTLCTRPPNRLRARRTRRTAIARTATDCRGSAPVTSILNALSLASIQKLVIVRP
jgi:hypothetical protein